MENKKYDTDETMRKLWLHLSRDFSNVLGLEYASTPRKIFVDSGIKGFRNYRWPFRSQVSPVLFKADYQLENLFKRYRFKDDMFSDDELLALSQEKFLDTQKRISSPLCVTQGLYLVLQRARILVKEILGEYCLEEHMSLCRFGKRACVGTPYSKSYLDLKLSGPLTGSKDHISWFKRYLVTDSLLDQCLNASSPTGVKTFKECDTLDMSFVPKSYKALRGIMPDTLLGSFYTHGLGRLLQDRLLGAGLNIKRLQDKHRRLVRSNSISRRLATADLSAASDSISIELLRRLLPTKWFHVILHGRINKINLAGTTVMMNSVITMGLGQTFPLQTLIFYALLKSIAELAGFHEAYISVYGDDLIYPSRLHRYVSVIFPKLHLILNADKTFVHDYFRESCGSDFFRGCDVRPFQPEGSFTLLDRMSYAVFLYKILNGLLLRWDGVEIPLTLEYLKCELILTQGIIFQVPPSFPDGSGLKVDRICSDYFYSPVTYALPQHVWMFNYLHVCSDFRVVKTQYPYYWERMRTSNSKEDAYLSPWDRQVDEPQLRWNKRTFPVAVRGQKKPRKVKRLVPGVSSKTKNHILRQTGSTSCWT